MWLPCESGLTEAELHARTDRLPETHVCPSGLSVNGNLFGSISTHRCNLTARDPYFI